MGLLTPHFLMEEFERDGVMPANVVASYVALAEEVLEPLRAQYDEPYYVTSGYRSEEVNKRIGGVPDSQHVATIDYCAADGYFASFIKNMRPVFDWMRMDSKLIWDQLIIEHGKYSDILHISWSKTPRLMALEGATYNRSPYTEWPVQPRAISA